MSKVYLEDSTLTGIANAIREKTGGSASITPANMATEIGTISGGGSEPIDMIPQLSTFWNGGLMAKLLENNFVNLVRPQSDNQLNTVTVNLSPPVLTSLYSTANSYQTAIDSILPKLSNLYPAGYQASAVSNLMLNNPLGCFVDPNMGTSSIYLRYNVTFTIDEFDLGTFLYLPTSFTPSGNWKLYSSIPKVNLVPNSTSAIGSNEYSFRSCLTDNFMRVLIKKIIDTNNTYKTWLELQLSRLVGGLDGSSGGAGMIHFGGQWYLEDLPNTLIVWFRDVVGLQKSNYSNYLNYMYYECYKLTTAYIPVVPFTSTSNTFRNTPRLRHIIFLDKGISFVSNGTNVAIYGAGYNRTSGYVTDKQDVCPDAKKIYDATTYAALKNDPDAWAAGVEWSFYGHSAAAETLVSLPNQNPCPDGYNRPCTITFEQNSGLNTDDGPISNLTAEEIAVATNKGWTVSLV